MTMKFWVGTLLVYLGAILILAGSCDARAGEAVSADDEYLQGLKLEKQEKYGDAKLAFERADQNKTVIDSDVKKKISQKIEQIKKELADFESKKEEYVKYLNTVKVYNTSSYAKDAATKMLERVNPNKEVYQVTLTKTDLPKSTETQPSAVPSIVGKYKYVSGTLTFNADGTCHASSGNLRGKWEVKGTEVEAFWDNGRKNTYRPIQNSPGKWTGVKGEGYPDKGLSYEMTKMDGVKDSDF